MLGEEMESGLEQRLETLERSVAAMSRRLEALEKTVSSIELEVRQINESEDIGVTQ